MASIDECYRLLKYRATKAGFNGNVSPNDFNLIWPRAERRHFNSQYKQYLLTQEIGESLLPFKTNPITVTIDVTGKWTKPTPNVILHMDAVRGLVDSVEIVRFADDRLANKLASEYDAPTATFPIYVDYETYLQFYPINLGSAKIVYLQKLVDSKWAYTLVDDRPVYDEDNSIQPKWSDDDIDEISYIVLSDLGVSMRDGMVQQFAERKIQTDL